MIKTLVTGLCAVLLLSAAALADKVIKATPKNPSQRSESSSAKKDVTSARLRQILDGKRAPANAEDLIAFQKRIQTIAAKVVACTVCVRIGNGSGSGVIVSEDGYVMSAGHVVGRPGRDVVIIMPDGRELEGKTLGVNLSIDSGLIKITDAQKLPYCDLGKSEDLQPGQWCLVTGHPGGYRKRRTPPVRLGRVLSSSARAVRTDCLLVGGDSGGPLFDLDGKIIGINSRIGSSLASNLHVPVDTFHTTWERLAKSEVIPRGPPPGTPYIGILSDPKSDEAKVARVLDDSPAAKAGIKPGDVVVKIAGKVVKNFLYLQMNVRKKRPGDKIEVVVKRGDKTITLKLTIGKYK